MVLGFTIDDHALLEIREEGLFEDSLSVVLFEDFARDNADDEALASWVEELASTGEVFIGGGAAPFVVITLAKEVRS